MVTINEGRGQYRVRAVETVTVGGARGQNFARVLGDVAIWTREEAVAYGVDVVVKEVRQQEKLGNPLTSVLVDGSPFKPLGLVRRDIVANFGSDGRDMRRAMRAVEFAVARFGLEPRGIYWEWLPGPGFPKDVALTSSSPAPIPIGFGQTVYFVPRGRDVNLLAQFNQQFVDAISPPMFGDTNRLRAPSPGRPGAFLRVKRSANRPLRAEGFWLKAGFSEKAARAAGARIGRQNSLSPRTGRPSYRQGIPFFQLKLRVR